MATSGSATGGNDNFNGKARVFWWLVSQDYGANTSTVRWAWCVSWAAGDNCHSIRAASVSGNGVTRWSASNTHDFVSGHVHSGDWPAVNSGSGGGFATGTYVIGHAADGTAQVQVSASHVGSSGPTSTATTGADALPVIPQTPAPISGGAATRVNDGQINVSWTNNSTAAAPYSNVKIYRTTDGGGWANIATLGVVTSYTDTGVAGDHKYRYGMNAVGANGVEVGGGESPDIWTSPDVPSNLTATKLAGGNIRLAWTNNVGYSEYTTRIEESQNGGAFTEIASVASGVATWDHIAPIASNTHKYRIRARTSSGATLNSGYSADSALIVLLSTANAPSGLAPSGATFDATEAIVFTWTHNPADGTPQSKYQLQYKIGAGAFVTVGPTTSTVRSYTMPASTVTNGQTITWHVATAGENGTLSAYSADSVFTTQNRPTSTISAPGSSITQSKVTATWTYFQSQGSAQSAWHAYLYKKGALSDYSDATLVGESSGSGTTSSFVFPTTLLDGQTYAVQVFVTSASGLTSVAAGTPRKEFVVTYLPPADATLTASHDSYYGRTVVTVTGAGANPSGPALNSNPYFETDASGYFLKAGATFDRGTAFAYEGVGSGLLTPNGTSLTAEVESWPVPTSPGTGMLLRMMVRIPISRNMNFAINWFSGAATNAPGTGYLSSTVAPATAIVANTFTLVTLSGTAPAGANSASMVAYLDGTPAASTTLRLDAVQLSIPAQGTETIDTVDLQRKIGNGEWVTWAAGIVLQADTLQAILLDTTPTLKGTNYYRAVIRSAVPSSKLSAETTSAVTEPSWGFLNSGPGFADVIRMRARLSPRSSVGRNKNVYHFAGRGKPVELSGEETNLALAVQAILHPASSGQGGLSSEPEEMEAAGLDAGVVVWRDYTGRRIFASLSDVNVDYSIDSKGLYPVSFGLTQVDYDENVG